jgi:hypothetical protein
MTDEGGTLGGPTGFTLGGSYQDLDVVKTQGAATLAGGTLGGPTGFRLGGYYLTLRDIESPSGATLGDQPDLTRRVDATGRARIRIELTGGVRR